MIPVFVCNSRGEAINYDLLGYCFGVNNCDYLKVLFNNKATVYDKDTVDLIDYNKYNSIPILFDKSYRMYIPGMINIHSNAVLDNYLEEYNLSQSTYIVSVKDYIIDDINNFSKIIIIFDMGLDLIPGEPIFLDSKIWAYRKSPLMIDNQSIVYTAINKAKAITLATQKAGRLLLKREKDIIINALISDESEVPYINGIPLLNI